MFHRLNPQDYEQDHLEQGVERHHRRGQRHPWRHRRHVDVAGRTTSVLNENRSSVPISQGRGVPLMARPFFFSVHRRRIYALLSLSQPHHLEFVTVPKSSCFPTHVFPIPFFAAFPPLVPSPSVPSGL